MAYNNNIPQPGDLLSDSQADILANFQAIEALVSYDHVDFGPANAGAHNTVTFPVQAIAPVFVQDLGIYNFLSPITALNELYVHHKLFAGLAVNTSMTASSRSVQLPVMNSAGYTNTPSGIIFRWGKTPAQIPANVNTAIAVPATANYPVFSTIFAVIPYVYDATANNWTVKLVSIDNAAQFTVRTSGLTFVYYLIIGI